MPQDDKQICDSFLNLVNIMRRLRGPNGCSWDKKQTEESLAGNVKEEAQEVYNAVFEKSPAHVCEELGDLLMLIVFYAQMADEKGIYGMKQVSDGICEKLIRRHPHIFGENSQSISPDEVMKQWGEIKKQERADKSKLSSKMSEALRFSSPVIATETIQARASEVGFDWKCAQDAFYKIGEETNEVFEAMQNGDKQALEEEIGDLFFAVINIARLLGLKSEGCIKASTAKFIKRFEKLEALVKQEGGFEGKSFEKLDEYWQKIKHD